MSKELLREGMLLIGYATNKAMVYLEPVFEVLRCNPLQYLCSYAVSREMGRSMTIRGMLASRRSDFGPSGAEKLSTRW